MRLISLVTGTNVPVGDVLTSLPLDVVDQRARQRRGLLCGGAAYLMLAFTWIFLLS